MAPSTKGRGRTPDACRRLEWTEDDMLSLAAEAGSPPTETQQPYYYAGINTVSEKKNYG